MPPEAEAKQDAEKPAKSSKKMILIIIIALVLLGGGGAGAYFKFFAAKDPNQAKADESKKEEAEPIVKDLDTFIVNLSDPGGKRFLKATIKATLTTKEGATEFEGRNFELKDSILMILSSKESEEIAANADRINLKQEIVTALNRILKKGKVKDVFFTEFLIQ